MSLLIGAINISPVEATIVEKNGVITMTAEDYRGLVTGLIKLEAENASLKDVLARERGDVNRYIAEVEGLRVAIKDERAAKDARINFLDGEVRRLKRRAYYPGIVLGGGAARDGGVQAVAGIGWKIDLF